MVVPPVPATPGSTPGSDSSAQPAAGFVGGVYAPSFRPGEPLALKIWITPYEKHDPSSASSPLVEFRSLSYSYNQEPQLNKLVLSATDDIVNRNQSLYLHAYLRTTLPELPERVAEIHTRLNRFMPPPPPESYKNLLESSAEERQRVEQVRKEHEKKPWLSYWRDNVTLAMVTDMQPMDLSKMPATMTSMLTRDDVTRTYMPPFYINDFWTYKDHFYLLNDTVKELPLLIEFAPLSMWKWQMYTQMDQSFATQQAWGMASEIDEMKRVLSETNPWFLGLTMVVSLTHMVFDFLSFKNDISFWRTRKSLEGLSVRSILISFGCQFIIFLYLLDNETSWMILLSAGVSVVIEGWKITKTNDVTVSSKFPFIHLKDKNSYISKTKEFDEVAVRYLSYALYPMVAVYAIYSLLYDTHKSYYSWFIGSLSGAVYMFGFLQMTPQLFINYKLRSVAHLPWRVFVYKALNTFIDDMFAFIIKMPTMHRLSVFRDDIIFFIFLYQRWLYPVDKTRVNEFGQSFEEPKDEGKKDAAPPKTTSHEKVD